MNGFAKNCQLCNSYPLYRLCHFFNDDGDYLPAEMTSTVTFPRAATEAGSSLSLVPRHATALEVCDIVYGNSESTASLDAVERFYETNAIYENPFITATSRSVISDIYALARQLCYVDIPKPLAMLYILFRLKRPEHTSLSTASNDPWFQGLRVWTEIGEICESESFDGHRRSIVEHTVNVLFLPGLHSDRTRPKHSAASSSSLIPDSSSSQLLLGNQYPSHPSDPRISIPGTGLGVPSPLHLQLHILTRLSFNEQGRITHHRDIWDVRDVLGLVPGVSLAQWIGARLAATSLTFAARLFTGRRKPARSLKTHAGSYASEDLVSLAPDLEQGSPKTSGVTPAVAYGACAENAVGLEEMSTLG